MLHAAQEMGVLMPCFVQAFGAGDSFAVLVWGWAAAIGLSVMCCAMASALWVADSVAVHLFKYDQYTRC